MSQPTRSCARCTRPAIVTRANAPYCIECNTIMDWSEVITAVQQAFEPEGTPGVANVAPPPHAPAGAGSVATVEADPFAQRLS